MCDNLLECSYIDNSRFVLKYKNNFASNNSDSTSDIRVYASNSINVKSFGSKIKNVVIFDVLGKKLFEAENISSNELQITELKHSNNVLLVKVTLENSKIEVRKIIY